MAKAIKKAASQEDAAKKEIFFSVTEGEKTEKYQVLGKSFIFKGDKFTAEEVVKNEELCAALIASGAPSIVKV
jgi:hypothetical protein